LSAAALICALAVLGCKSPYFGNQLSVQQETEIGKQASAIIQSQYPVATNSANVGQVNEVAGKIFAKASLMRPEVTYKIGVLQMDDQLSCSLPGGWIYVDSGLVNYVNGDQDVLAAIIAHEAAHVVLKHGAKQITDAYGPEGLQDNLSLGKFRETAQAALQLELIGQSQENELRADRLAVKLVTQAGYDPKGLLRWFELAQKKQVGKPVPVWLKTHPITAARIKRAEQDINDLQAGKY